MRCLLGIHKWLYPQTVAIFPGMMRRGCQRCGRIDYHDGRKDQTPGDPK